MKYRLACHFKDRNHQIIKNERLFLEWFKHVNEDNDYSDVIKPFTVVHDSIVSEVREDLVDTYIENAKRCIQTDRGLSIPDCPIKVDFEIGPSWGELDEI